MECYSLFQKMKMKKTVEKLQRFSADEGTRTPTSLDTRS